MNEQLRRYSRETYKRKSESDSEGESDSERESESERARSTSDSERGSKERVRAFVRERGSRTTIHVNFYAPPLLKLLPCQDVCEDAHRSIKVYKATPLSP